MRIHFAIAVFLFCSSASVGEELSLDKSGPLMWAWYNPHQLLSTLAERDSIRWAMPETLAGNALVGGESVSARSVLDDACKQWGLAWKISHGVVVVERPMDDLSKLSIWQLGWSRDGRAIVPLAEALAGDDIGKALEAAAAIEILDKAIPLGRAERVDPIEPGRVSLAAAYPPALDVAAQLDSPYSSIRAAALRLLLASGDGRAKSAAEKTARDRSDLVRQVRQEVLYPAAAETETSSIPAESGGDTLPPIPSDVPAACRKMIADLVRQEKDSSWEAMRRSVRVMAHWARLGNEAAVDPLIALGQSKHQSAWYPAYAQMQMADVGHPKIVARLREVYADQNADHATLGRGLERVVWGEALLGYTQPFLDEQSVIYITANKAGAEAVEQIAQQASAGNFAAIDALGVIGGPQAVAVLTRQVNDDDSATRMFRALKALANVGTADALAALLAAADSDQRFRRHAGTIFLGRIGGPHAVAKLLERIQDPDRLVAAAASDALAQIGDQQPKVAAALTDFRKRDASLPEQVYRPRNPRFGPDFPVNEWVDLKIPIEAYAAYGEIGWNYDAANRLFMRYGGCSGYTNELTLFDLGTEQFVQRRPNEEMVGWDSRRPSRGCTGGRVFDPWQKVVWVGATIGGTEADLAIAEYYLRGGEHRFSSYDLVTDRFRSAPCLENTYGGPPIRYACDWRNGLVYPVKFSPFPNEKPFWAIDIRKNPYRADAWLDKQTKDDYPRMQHHTIGAVDLHSGLLVVYIPPGDDSPEPQTWTFDPSTNKWSNMKPDVQPRGVAGAGFDYDPFQKLLILQSGREVTQYGGPKDSITWTYDVRSNTWNDTRAENGPGNPWVGATAFDHEHNVLVMFNATTRGAYAYRLKTVAAGTKVQW